jgi:protein gp37
VAGEGEFGQWEIDSKALNLPENDRKPRRFLVDDIFAECFSDYIASQHIKLFQKTPWHTYLVVSSNIRRLMKTSGRTNPLQLPDNAWIGTLIKSTSDFDQIETLGALATPNKWVSFLPFKSGRPIRESNPALEEILRKAGIRWVVFGGDQIDGWEITEDDEKEIARASHAAGCPVYCTSFQTLNDMLTYGTVDSRSVPGIFANGTRPKKTWKLRELPDFNHTSLGLST